MKISEAIRRIKKARPTTPEEFAKAGVPLCRRALGAGVFREVIRCRVCDIVVKFPLSDGATFPSYGEGIDHTNSEVRKIERLRKLRWMRKYLPKIYYHDRKAGILVMAYYPEFKSTNIYGDFGIATGNFVADIFRHATRVRLDDYSGGNALKGDENENGYPGVILIDLGY